MASQNRAIVDKLLSNVSSAYVPDDTMLIGDKILPFIGVKQSTGLLGKYGTSHLRIENSIKVGRGKYREVEPIVRSSTGYQIRGHGLEGLVTKDDYRNVEVPFKAEQDETLGLTTMIMLEKEKILADAITDSSVMTNFEDLSGTTKIFSDYLNSTPVEYISDKKVSIMNACGAVVNFLAMDYAAAEKLRYHPELLSALGYKFDRPGGLNNAEIASALGIDNILVASARYETKKEGQATAGLSPIWGKHIVLGVSPKSAQPYQVSLGYRMGFDGQDQRKVYKYAVNNPPESTGILVEDEYQYLLSNVNAGFLIKNAIA